MAWSAWPRKSTVATGSTLAGLDINGTRIRGAAASAGTPPRPMLLADSDEELPLAISLEGRVPCVAPAALAFRRAAPHLLCAGFLPSLGQVRTWSAGRHRLDAAEAMGLVAKTLKPKLTEIRGAEICLPAYLSLNQTKLVRSTLEAARVPLLGTIALPLALAAHDTNTQRGLTLVLDADDELATWSLIETNANYHRLRVVIPMTYAGIRGWVDRLLGFVADRCIRLCRRDPRDSAQAEQSLDEQITEFLRDPRPGQPLTVRLRTEHWVQILTISWDDITKICATPANLVADEGQAIVTCINSAHPPDVIWITSAAAKLPRLLETISLRWPERTSVLELAPEAGAEAAWAVAARRVRGELPSDDLRDVVPRLSPATTAHPVA
jgi:hypothetical protein